MPSLPGISHLRTGFLVNFTHESLMTFPLQTAQSEYATRKAFFDALLGAKAAAYHAEFGGATPLGLTSVRGHIGGQQAWQLAKDAVQRFNALGTGAQFGDPPVPPHCVRYEIVDGQVIVIYNFLVMLQACPEGVCPPLGATYHVFVQVTDPDGTDA